VGSWEWDFVEREGRRELELRMWERDEGGEFKSRKGKVRE
jgi:hypothetical protein